MELILITYFVLMLLEQLQVNALERHINQSSYCEIAVSKKKQFMETAEVSLGRPNVPSVIPNHLLFRSHKRF